MPTYRVFARCSGAVALLSVALLALPLSSPYSGCYPALMSPANTHETASDCFITAQLEIVCIEFFDSLENFSGAERCPFFACACRVHGDIQEGIGGKMLFCPECAARDSFCASCDAYSCNNFCGIQGKVAEIVVGQDDQRAFHFVGPVVTAQFWQGVLREPLGNDIHLLAGLGIKAKFFQYQRVVALHFAVGGDESFSCFSLWNTPGWPLFRLATFHIALETVQYVIRCCVGEDAVERAHGEEQDASVTGNERACMIVVAVPGPCCWWAEQDIYESFFLLW